MLSIALLAALHAAVSSEGSDWPGWRGPNGSGVAAGSPPTEWSEEKNVRWKAELPGKGVSSPIVWKDSVFVTTAIGTGKVKEGAPAEAGGPPPEGRPDEGRRGDGGGRGRGGRNAPIEEQDFVVMAFDRKTGDVQWERKLATATPHQGTHQDGSFASSTPVTDGEQLFASFGSDGLYALDMKGKVLWSVDLGDMDIVNGFGEGSSPVLCGDLVLLNWDHEGDSFLVALDKKSGKERWRTPRQGGTSWVTPLLVTLGATQQVIVGGPRTIAYDPSTGKELWHEGENERSGAIASPVALDELIVFASGGRGGGEARALRAHAAAKSGEAAEAALWKQKIDGPHVPSPLAYDGKVYLLKQDSGMLSVLDPATGKIEYGPERLKGVADVYASLVAANKHLYVAGRDGTVEVLTPWPKIESVAVNRLEDGFDASPAIAGDELFLRGKANLYCVAAK